MMRISISTLTISRVLLAVALSAASVLACLDLLPAMAAQPLENPNANSTELEWFYLDSERTHRHTFTHHKNSDSDAISKAIVQLTSEVADAFHFEIKRADTMQPIGVSVRLNKLTNQSQDQFTHIWVGGTARETIKIYVDVTNRSPFRSAYTFEIKGDDISVPRSIEDSTTSPILVPTNRQSAEQVGPPAEVKTRQIQLSRTGLRKLKKAVDDSPGGSPSSALDIHNADWSTLSAGEKRWYAFDYDFDQHAESQIATTIQVETDVVDALSLAVTTARMNIIGIGIRQDKVTGSAGDDSRVIWSSGTLISGRYFVEVSNESQTPVRFRPSLLEER